MESLKPTLETARREKAAGNLLAAEEFCLQILPREGKNPDVWLLLGDVRLGLGKAAEAVAAYQHVLHVHPQLVHVNLALANALAAAGHKAEAAKRYRKFLSTNPKHPEAVGSLGLTPAELGKLDEAIPTLRAAVALKPDFATAHHNLGVALAHHGEPDAAIAAFRQALHYKPDYPEACYNLGNVLAELKERDEAVAVYRQALQLRPDYFDAYNNLGLLLNDLHRFGEAVVFLQQAVRLRPQSPEAHNNLGMVYAEQGNYAAAEASYQEALRLNPAHAEAHSNLANWYKDQGRLVEAVESYGIALAYQPDSVSAHWNRSLAWLQMGDFERGWPEYEWRWQRKQTPHRPFAQPRWDGTPLAGRRILLWMEQGLGDAIQFIRYAAILKGQPEKGDCPSLPKGQSPFSNSTVFVECPAFMIPLFSTCPGIDQLVPEGSPLPDFDVQAPLMSLPYLCHTTLATIPNKPPYLFANPDLVEKWRTKLSSLAPRPSPLATRLIGICWQGNPHHPSDRYRSIPLRAFAPLAKLDGVRLISLQRGAGTEQLAEVKDQFAVTVLDEELDTSAGGFMDTAAIMQNLDIVISADTAVAHLAGALGVPVWLALSSVVDWRWLMDREDSPWYPTMRLFRQKERRDWRDVFIAMADSLHSSVPGL